MRALTALALNVAAAARLRLGANSAPPGPLDVVAFRSDMETTRFGGQWVDGDGVANHLLGDESRVEIGGDVDKLIEVGSVLRHILASPLCRNARWRRAGAVEATAPLR
jgi:hypothetical protein